MKNPIDIKIEEVFLKSGNELITLATMLIYTFYHTIKPDDSYVIESKEELLEKILNNDEQLIGWVLTELMVWGCDKNYMQHYMVNQDQVHPYNKGEFIFFAENKYYKPSGENFKLKEVKRIKEGEYYKYE